MPPLSRRDVLVAGTGGALAAFLTGCCRLKLTPLPSAATPPQIYPSRNPKLPFAIDAHAHVFNGTDLQVKQFLTLSHDVPLSPGLTKLLTGLLQFLLWHLAPTGCEEYRVLGELAREQDPGRRQALVQSHRRAGLMRFAREVKKTPTYKSAQTSAAAQPWSADEEKQYQIALKKIIDDPVVLEDPAQATAKVQAFSLNISAIDLIDILRFLAKGFHYRYINVLDYLETYNGSNSSARNIDLMVVNMVDFDWPLALGSKTRTSLKDQVSLMERLSIFAHGRVHAMVPFDPMREVAEMAGFKAGHGKRQTFSFQEVRDAVTQHGCLGVKLYPVMGFRPTGNAALPANTWSLSSLPSWMANPITINGVTKSFGAWMDETLDALYKWCHDNEVPITLHANPSEGRNGTFDSFATDLAWGDVLKTYPNLRLNFGHLGMPTGFRGGSSNADSALVPFLAGPETETRYAYGDLSYPAGALFLPQNQLVARLQALFQLQQPGANTADLHDRVMYGTDWLMLLQEPHSELCLENMATAFSTLDTTTHSGPTYSDRFFALNAIRWLGLAKGQKTRTRLESFYVAQGLDITANPPAWITQVDALVPSA